MGKSGFSLSVVADTRTMFFGERVNGKVVVENAEGAKCRTVRVKLVANLVVKLDNTAPTIADSAWNKVFPLVAERGPQIVLWSERTSPQKQVFPSGVTEFPFVVETAAFTQLPPSFESMKGAVRWFLEAEFERPFKLNITARAPVSLVPAIPVDNPSYASPVSKSKTEQLRGFLSSNGQITTTVTLDHGAYLPGDFIQVSGVVVNQTSKCVISTIKVEVVQCVVAFDGDSKRVATSLPLFETPGIPGGATVGPGLQLPFRVSVCVPQGVPSFLHSHLAVSYNVKVTAVGDKACSDVSCPFILGSFSPAAAHAAPPSAPGSYAPAPLPMPMAPGHEMMPPPAYATQPGPYACAPSPTQPGYAPGAAYCGEPMPDQALPPYPQQYATPNSAPGLPPSSSSSAVAPAMSPASATTSGLYDIGAAYELSGVPVCSASPIQTPPPKPLPQPPSTGGPLPHEQSYSSLYPSLSPSATGTAPVLDDARALS